MDAAATQFFEGNLDEMFTTIQEKQQKEKSVGAKTVIKGFILSSALVGVLLQSAYATAPIDFSDLVAQVAPAVVRVTAVKKLSKEEQVQQQLPEMLKKYLSNQVIVPNQSKPKTDQKSYGSAFFISQDGYLLTNRHVVGDVKKVTITLNDRRELDADVIGSDERTDVAVLKVKGDHYPALKIGNSDSLRVGEPVLAIGSPFGFDYSASAGIVSATSRSVTSDGAVPFIQSDVAMNPGNSGGPLFNQHGDVIGINSRIFSGTGGSMGLSFSIPIDVAMDVANQLKKDGKVSRAYLGVYPQDIDRNLAEIYHLPKPEGALVVKISPNSAASAAGIKEGDIILSYNKQPISQASDLINYINRARPDTVVAIGIQRDGKLLTLNPKLKAATDDDDAEEKSANGNVGDSGNKLGFKLREMTDKESVDTPSTQGVVVDSVDPDGLADRAQLKVGDVITNLNNHPTPNLTAFLLAQKSLPQSGVVEVIVMRDNIPFRAGLRIE